MMRRTAPLLLSLVFVVACSDGDAAPAALPTAPPTAAPTSTDDDTTTTTTTTTTPDGIRLSEDGPWTLVDSAPGITEPGLVYRLMDGLWVYLPVEEDIAAGRTWILTERDLPVIEAYLRARLVYYEAITSKPIELDHPGWAEWYLDAGASYLEDLQVRRQQGQVADLDVGNVLRPQVLGQDRTDQSAVVFDCVLDGGFFVLPSGALAPGSSRGVAESGIAFAFVMTSNGWRVEQVGKQPDACD